MNILFIGDIFASPGRGIVADNLNRIITEHKISLALANAENSAGGFGITPLIAEELLSLGMDVLTGGNHSFDKREIFDYMANHPRLLRPANYPNGLPGSGVYIGTARNGVPYAVLNIQGRAQMTTNIDCPFKKVDELLAGLDASYQNSHCRFSRGIDKREDGDGLASGRPGDCDDWHAYARTDGGCTSLDQRARVPDGRGDDGTI